MRVLLAGSSGYFGTILYEYLNERGYDVIGIDIVASKNIPLDKQIICDLTKKDELGSAVSMLGVIDIIINLATQIDFAVDSQKSLYENNILSAKNLADVAVRLKIKRYIFTSSNSIYLGCKTSYISDENPVPIDSYGRSKYDSEKLLSQYSEYYQINIIRCPNIMDAGRVGMMSILFDLIRSNSTLWVLDGGKVRHQCVYAKDLCDAIVRLLSFPGSSTFNIGSKDVKSFKETFEQLLLLTGSHSKIRSVPSILVVPFLKILYKLKLSPLGPYQFRMLTADFEFDLKQIEETLGWKPTKNNVEIMKIAYTHYCENYSTLNNAKTANSAPVKMKLLNLLKLIKW